MIEILQFVAQALMILDGRLTTKWIQKGCRHLNPSHVTYKLYYREKRKNQIRGVLIEGRLAVVSNC